MKRKAESTIPTERKKRKCTEPNWVQCDYCAKWRRVPASKVFHGEWSCEANKTSCTEPQEIEIGDGVFGTCDMDVVDIQTTQLVDIKLQIQRHQESYIIEKNKVKATPNKKPPKLHPTEKPQKAKKPPKLKPIHHFSDSDEEYHLPGTKKKKKTKKNQPKKERITISAEMRARIANQNYETTGYAKVDDALDELETENDQENRERRDFYRKVVDFLGKEPFVTRLNAAIVDLHKLYNLVVSRGGYSVVCNKKLWREVFRSLPQGASKAHTSASWTLKKLYTNYLKDFEIKELPDLNRTKEPEPEKKPPKKKKKQKKKKGGKKGKSGGKKEEESSEKAGKSSDKEEGEENKKNTDPEKDGEAESETKEPESPSEKNEPESPSEKEAEETEKMEVEEEKKQPVESKEQDEIMQSDPSETKNEKEQEKQDVDMQSEENQESEK